MNIYISKEALNAEFKFDQVEKLRFFVLNIEGALYCFCQTKGEDMQSSSEDFTHVMTKRQQMSAVRE